MRAAAASMIRRSRREAIGAWRLLFSIATTRVAVARASPLHISVRSHGIWRFEVESLSAQASKFVFVRAVARHKLDCFCYCRAVLVRSLARLHTTSRASLDRDRFSDGARQRSHDFGSQTTLALVDARSTRSSLDRAVAVARSSCRRRSIELSSYRRVSAAISPLTWRRRLCIISAAILAYALCCTEATAAAATAAAVAAAIHECT